jgi:two-component system phosphate regulon sensor histidine kinase PhoR
MSCGVPRLASILFGCLLPIVGLAVVAGVLHGAAWGWAAAALGFLLLVIAQAKRLSVLLAWLDAPETAESPDARGAWGEVFLKLSRRLRHDARRIEDAEGALASFRNAMDAVPDGLVILDGHHQIQWSNRAAAGHLGIQLVARSRRNHRTVGPYAGFCRVSR